MFKFSQLILVLSFLFSFTTNAIVVEGTVASIHDGDTLRMVVPGMTKEVRVRFMGIDTPEIDFKGFSQGDISFEARDYLKQLLPIGATIQVDTGDQLTDKNNRLLGTIYYDGININRELLRSGLAAMYFIAPYEKDIVAEYVQVAKEAYLAKRGMFQYEKNEVELPYQFRMRVQGFIGTNIVGNYETKKLYSPEDIEKVPPYARVFFKYEEMAFQRGFKWRD
ncbi:nuclease-like protein [Bacteriovorax sp. BSW11_IV]|uniref:thermonuclease family protein n=1 Tax=Bacteriovorax sp. BSW11_IV TaxID=1353529 RepID=UPI000389FEFA|nr:thermonuclease family protein [Bacteriovorax sp. BSW11_IV]EQC48361.1 nuclease-like protein [Bacteriovorax sp. BSW11_IV]